MSAPRRRFGEEGHSSIRSHLTASSNNNRTLTVDGQSETFWNVVICVGILLFLVVHTNYHIFPDPAAAPVAPGTAAEKGFVPTKDNGRDAENERGFIEQNARIFLDTVCDLGTRHLGSHANEVLAADAIVKEVNEIITKAATKKSRAHQVDIDVQSPSGCFDLAFIGNFTTCYSNVKNVLVKLSPTSASASSGALLVNCHYDTAVSSPGASDDLVSCAIMLETLRVLSLADVPLMHSIIFNFNGAEEAILQASHGFITQHPWAKNLKAFVNLEAAGSGGREMVFQTGPEHPWLVAAYAQSAKYPVASVIAQEIFQSGVIPSDTDFRIYRDYGHIPGIDIAYTYNGYIYHTIYDLPEFIPAGCIQRGGENLLSLLNTLGNSDKLEDPGDTRLGKMVFFDVMGFFMVLYPLRLGEIINSLVVIAVLLNIYRRIKSFTQSGGSSALYVKLITASYTMHAVGFLLIILCDIALALIINSIRPMMWYTNTWLIFPVYTLPAIAVWILVHQQGRSYFNSIFQLVSVWDLEVIYFDTGLLFWTLLLAILTIYGVASAYICMLLVAFPLFIRQFIVGFFNIKLLGSCRLYLTLTAAGLLPPFLHIMQLVYHNNIFFVPLLGRSGSEVAPDVVVAVLSAVPVLVASTYMAGFLHISKDLKALARKYLLVSFIFILVGCFTDVGFPYSDNPKSPSPQRHAFHHYWREFYAFDGSLEREDHGLLYIPFDYNGHRYLDNIPEMKSMQLQPVDDDLAYSGFPYYLPLITILGKLYISDIPKPVLKNKVTVTHSKELLSNHIIRYHFTTSGEQVYVNVFISVREGGELVGWSFTPGAPIPTKMPPQITRKHYFVYTTSATSPHPPRQFWLDVQVLGEAAAKDEHWLDIAFAAHYLDGDDSTTPELNSVLRKFPNWTVPLGWVATLQHYRL